MKQTTMNIKHDKRKYYLIDAKDRIVGDLAVEIANALRGKDNPEYVPHIDSGDYVIVINSKHIRFTGTKWKNKKYYSHSTKPGKLKVKSATKVHEDNPTIILYKAVKGMLQKNRIADKQLTRLKLFPSEVYNLKHLKPQIVDSLRNRGA